MEKTKPNIDFVCEVPGETAPTKAQQSTQDSWARAYADYYQAQEYPSEKKSSRSPFRALIWVVTALLIMAIGVTVLYAVYQDKLWAAVRNGIQSVTESEQLMLSSSQEVTAEEVLTRLNNLQSFLSAKSEYQGRLHYEEGKIPFLTQRSYNLNYRADAQIGIAMEEFTVEVNDSQVIVTVPKAELLSLYVDPNSLTYEAEKNSLLFSDSQPDSAQALSDAEADARANMDLEEACYQLESRVESGVISMLQDEIGNRQLIVRHR